MLPFLRWAGSKRQIIGQLAQLWGNRYTRYIEPFMGSACLFFNICPQSAVLGDINADLVETFIAVKNSPESVQHFYSQWELTPEVYYNVRALPTVQLSSEERAARFIYLNRCCFNGLYRTNRRGEFNVPFGVAQKRGLPHIQELIRASEILASAKILSIDFEDLILTHARAGDFIYLDPPYTTGQRRLARQQYGKPTFEDTDVNRLESLLNEIHHRGASFVLSFASQMGSPSLTLPWNQKVLKVRRNIAGFAGYRKTAEEVLITNIPIHETTQGEDQD